LRDNTASLIVSEMSAVAFFDHFRPIDMRAQELVVPWHPRD
jgi:hypothetical protein